MVDVDKKQLVTGIFFAIAVGAFLVAFLAVYPVATWLFLILGVVSLIFGVYFLRSGKNKGNVKPEEKS